MSKPNFSSSLCLSIAEKMMVPNHSVSDIYVCRTVKDGLCTIADTSVFIGLHFLYCLFGSPDIKRQIAQILASYWPGLGLYQALLKIQAQFSLKYYDLSLR